MRILGTLLVFCAVGLLPERLPAQTNTPKPNTIRVDIGGLRNDKGQVFCALYPSADGFPKKSENAVAKASSAIVEKKAVCEFSGIEAGTYAVSVFHDENSNGRLDSNFMGIPREGVGASNGARGHFGPPKFDDASFHFSGGQLNLKITVAYL
jgi:uncharacterized protein (DUF2141 family)